MPPVEARTAERPDHDHDDPWLIIEWVEKELGTDVAEAMLKNFGGRQLYVPRTPQPHHVLCKIIGLDHARKISKGFGGCNLVLPLRRFGAAAIRREAIKRAIREGRTSTSIVREFRVTSRSVHKIRARLRSEEG